jgi:ribose 5-phosphate isomerase B
MTMTANRMGVRAALCTNEFLARMAREHNDARILCLGERVTGQGLALAILQTFLDTGFGGERHQRRIDLIDAVSK